MGKLSANNMEKKILKGDPAPGPPWKFVKSTRQGGKTYYHFKLTKDVDQDNQHYSRS
jgi:hypothetical protein